MTTVTIDRDAFKSGVRAVAHAIDTDATRGAWRRSVLVRVVDDHWLELSTADGHRMARWRERIIAGDTSGAVLVSNAKPLIAWTKSLTRGGTVTIDFARGVITAGVAEFAIEAVSDDDHAAREAATDAAGSLDGVHAASVAGDRAAITARLRALATALGDDASVAEHVALLRAAARALDDACSVALHARYIADAAKACGDGTAWFNGALDPVIVRQSHAGPLTCIVMPVRQ